MGEYTHEGYVEQGAGLMLIQSEGVQFNILGRKRRLFSGGRLFNKLRGISKEGLGYFKYRSLMLFPDNQFMNPDALVQKALTETAMLYDIVGGPGLTAPDSDRQPAIFYYDKMLRTGLSAAEVLSQQPIGFALSNGWSPLRGPYRVTRMESGKITRLDGRPPREVYEDFFLDYLGTAEISPEHLLKFPIGICQGGLCKVSMVMDFDANGALMMTSPPQTGSLVHILTTQPDAMTLAAGRAVDVALSRLENKRAAGALFIDCMSTSLVLGEAYQQQQAVVRETLGQVPFLGFRSQGVLARLQGQVVGHYECSVATCILPD